MTTPAGGRMKERPIIFNAPMVRALLDGRKTQTRRIVKPQPDEDGLSRVIATGEWHDTSELAYQCPYGQPSDRLWVRETWGIFNDNGFCDTSLSGLDALPEGWHLAYKADHIDPANGDGPHTPFWRPSIHMPRWASRITLEITDVRVQRLQEISEKDAVAEGCSASGFVPTYNDPDNDAGAPEYEPASTAFFRLWESIHGGDSWDADPWVWAVSFRMVLP